MIANGTGARAKLLTPRPEQKIAKRKSGKMRHSGGWILRAFLRREDGNELVEVALAMPIFLLLIFGLFKFGIAINNQLILTQATGAGAQYLQQIRTNSTDPCADTTARIQSAGPTLSGPITVVVTMNGTTPAQSGNSCPGSQSYLVQGASVSVASSYSCDLVIYGHDFAPGCLLHAQVAEYEY